MSFTRTLEHPMGLLDGADIDLPCPKCGKKTEKTWRWLKDEPEFFVCSSCQTKVVLDYDEAGELARILRKIDDLGDLFGK